MRITELKQRTRPPKGLNSLEDVVLSPRNQQRLDAAARTNGGDAAWRSRKLTEAHELLALSQIAPAGRLEIGLLDLAEALKVLFWMRVPVPLRPDQNNELPLADRALLGLTYPEEAICRSLPGTSFVQILEPYGVWLASVGAAGQSLCLGTRIPCATPVKELVLASFGALSMQTYQVDEHDSAGVLNLEAARWWQHNLARVPLSTVPFLKADDLELSQRKGD